MNDDRCRHRFLEFMGSLKTNGYHVIDFNSNNNYDFIYVQYEHTDGLEPKALAWIHSSISVPIKFPYGHSVHHSYVQAIHPSNMIALEILDYELKLFEKFVAENIRENSDWIEYHRAFYINSPED